MFKAHTNKINDLGFSKDGNLLLSVSLDKSLRIWDVLTGVQIEWIEFKSIPMSVSISTNNQFIATSFIGTPGIYLWVNRTLYLDFQQTELVDSPIKINLPYSSKVRKIKTRKDFVALKKDEDDKKKEKVEKVVKEERSSKFIQLSKENQLKYRIIQNLEIIQERNEPQIKNKEKTKAPFFLFNINDLKLDQGKNVEKKENAELLAVLENYSHFTSKNSEKKTEKLKNEYILKEMLSKFNEGKISAFEISKVLNALNPYIIDLEIRNLDPILNNSFELLILFLKFIELSLNDKVNFEMQNAYLNRFLKIFQNECLYNEELNELLEKINLKIKSYTDELDELFSNVNCLISHFGQFQI